MVRLGEREQPSSKWKRRRVAPAGPLLKAPTIAALGYDDLAKVQARRIGEAIASTLITAYRPPIPFTLLSASNQTTVVD